MPRAPYSRTAGLAASTSAVLLMTGLVGGCGSHQEAQHPAAKGAAAPKASLAAARVLRTAQLEAALPNQFSIPVELGLEMGGRRGWDNVDATYCQSEGWPDEWCAEALAFASVSYKNYKDQGLLVRMISFADTATAARFFKGKGTVDEVGDHPPGDESDGYELDPPADAPDWSTKGIDVRQGAVIAKVEYAWKAGTEVRPGTVLDLTELVVRGIQQAQAGKPPTASAR
ncbi:hypothetical protein ACFWH1_35325 [Streptomyces sp. NPDC127037]|uniref:hypothetical protein n=1 Tax=Streptomyces sp. NPDC127037 TaxID=3347113 RepID=UPI0036669F8C